MSVQEMHPHNFPPGTEYFISAGILLQLMVSGWDTY